MCQICYWGRWLWLGRVVSVYDAGHSGRIGQCKAFGREDESMMGEDTHSLVAGMQDDWFERLDPLRDLAWR
jgi:hypothetical protein